MKANESQNTEVMVRKNGLKQYTNDWKGFVDIPLTEVDKRELADTPSASYPEPLAFIQDCLAEGYKLSLSPDETHGCVIATLTGRGAGNRNEGYSLSARGPDLWGSMLILQFKHVTICGRGRWADKGQSRGTPLDSWG